MARSSRRTPTKQLQGGSLVVSRYEQAASMLVASLLVLISATFVMFLIWVSGRIFWPAQSIPVTVLEDVGGGGSGSGPFAGGHGGVVDEAALIDALQRNRLAGAGLDVFEKEPVDPNNPLLKMDNVSLTNHYASYSEAAWERAQTQLGEEAVRIANGMWPMSLINPDVRHVIPPRTAARSWEVYSRELTVGRHR